MKTIEIKDITETYEQQRRLYNQTIISQYGKDIEKAPYASQFLNFHTYQRLISMMVELEDETVREIRLGVTSQGAFDTIFPEATKIGMSDKEQLVICDKIDAFFRVHKKEFIEGRDILEIVAHDKDNLLKCSFLDMDFLHGKRKKPILSKILKRSL